MKKPLLFIAETAAFVACMAPMVLLLCVLPDAARAADICAEPTAPDWAMQVALAMMFCAVMSILHGEIRNHLHWRRQRKAIVANIEGNQS